jgi:hypothetical protein
LASRIGTCRFNQSAIASRLVETSSRATTAISSLSLAAGAPDGAARRASQACAVSWSAPVAAATSATGSGTRSRRWISCSASAIVAVPLAAFDGPGIDAEFFADRTWKAILVVNIGRPGTDPWFDRLPRLSHEDYVEDA